MVWFLDPLRANISTTVRPPTSLTRKAQITIKTQMPRSVFERWMVPVDPGDTHRDTPLEREDPRPGETVGRLKPTRETRTMRVFKFTVARPSVVNKLARLQRADYTHGLKPRGGKGKWRRGLGCAKLWLPKKEHLEEDHRHAKKLSMIAGAMAIEFRQPVNNSRMPTLKLSYMVLTMDEFGNITFPTRFDASSKATLRKLACTNLKKMLDSPDEYPVDPSMRVALNATAGESIFDYAAHVAAVQAARRRRNAGASSTG